MSVSILISGQKKVVADVIPVGLITLISNVTSIYTGAAWLTCDGSAVSRTTYADLFAVIGTTFGPGDGSTTFNLPNASPTLISGAQTFSAFIAETVIKVNNTSPIAIDISAGAAQAGIRISIIEQTPQGLTIYTDAGPTHYQSCVLTQGMIVLEWDGTQWCLIGETVRMLVTFTSSTTWKPPFGAVYKFSPFGGGGGGGGASVGEYGGNAYGGSGGGGCCQQFSKYEPAGTTLAIAVGGGGAGGGYGANGGNGGTSTVNDGAITLYGMGGTGGGGASANGGSTVYGGSGGYQPATVARPGSIEYGGIGSYGACGSGSNGGAGGSKSGSGGANGGGGAAGKVYIEY